MKKPNITKLILLNKQNQRKMNIQMTKGQSKGMQIALFDTVTQLQVGSTITAQSSSSSDESKCTVSASGHQVQINALETGEADINVTALCQYINSLNDSVAETKILTAHVTISVANETELRLV
jgi:hypothetical protein